MAFIPKHLREWKPSLPSHQRCHWCVSGPHPVRQMGIIMEGIMRYQFCSDACCDEWQQRRHDRDVLEWLKHGKGERAKVLANSTNEIDPNEAACHRSLAGLCDVSRVGLSMPKDS